MDEVTRRKAIESILKREDETIESELALIKQNTEKFLLEEKGYSKDEIETDIEFEVEIESNRCKSKADNAKTLRCGGRYSASCGVICYSSIASIFSKYLPL